MSFETLEHLMDVFVKNTSTAIHNEANIFGALIIEGLNMNRKDLKKFNKESLNNLLETSIVPSIQASIRYFLNEAGDFSSYGAEPQEVITDLLKIDNFAGAHFDNGAIIRDYILTYSEQLLAASLGINDYSKCEVYIFRYSYNKQNERDFYLTSIHLTDAIERLLSTGNIQITHNQGIPF